MSFLRFFKLSTALILFCTVTGSEAAKLEIATLPAADSLILETACAQGFFKERNLEVKLVPFKSALEVGAAFRAGRISGQFGDLMNVIVQNETGVLQKVVAVTTHTEKKQRRFALVTSPSKAAAIMSTDDLKNTSTAMSSNTIIEYLLDGMRNELKLAEDALSFKEIKQIPVRLQLLLTGKVDTALLPEPLVTLAVSKGSRVLWDDRRLNETLAVISLKDGILDRKETDEFIAALNEAASFIKDNKDASLKLMLKKRLLPKEIAAVYEMIDLCDEKGQLPPLPSKDEFSRVASWMLQHGMIKKQPRYEDLILTK